MKVVLTGSNGQLGNNIIKYKPEGVNLIPTNRDSLDLSRSEKCLSIFCLKNLIGLLIVELILM